MAYLVLVRHGQSEWNALGQWTGLTDVPLNDEGRAEARKAATVLEDIELHKAYSSPLSRARDTLDIVMSALKKSHIPVQESRDIIERDYGDLTGKNKWKIKEEYGDEQFMQWRRSWDVRPPKGESLKDVSARALPYYEKHILADLKAGHNVIVSAHGNSLRSIMKHLDKVADEDAHKVEIMTAEVLVYEIDDNGKVISKKLRLENPKKV